MSPRIQTGTSPKAALTASGAQRPNAGLSIKLGRSDWAPGGRQALGFLTLGKAFNLLEMVWPW